MSLLVFSLVIFLTASQQSLAAETSESVEYEYNDLLEECEYHFEDAINTLNEMIANGTISSCFFEVLKTLNITMEGSEEYIDITDDVLDSAIHIFFELDEKTAKEVEECILQVEEDVWNNLTFQVSEKCQEEMDKIEKEMKRRRK